LQLLLLTTLTQFRQQSHEDLEADRCALDLKRSTYFFIPRASCGRLDGCGRDWAPKIGLHWITLRICKIWTIGSAGLTRVMSGCVKVFGCRPGVHDVRRDAHRSEGRRTKTSKGGNRDGSASGRWRGGYGDLRGVVGPLESGRSGRLRESRMMERIGARLGAGFGSVFTASSDEDRCTS
jgi:hypothetical protein